MKSDIIFESLTLSDSKGKYNFYFDASEFKQNSDNNKSKTFFKLHSIGFDENDIKQITIKVSNQKDLFPKLSNIFKQNSNEFNEEFLKALDNNKIKINEEELKKIFRSYRKQNEIDFFIHKNAKAFLEEQFDLWMFNHLYKDSQIQQWNPNAIKRMQEVRNIAYEIIYFIAKFEDELKAIWLKPKFAKNTEYVFSLDIIINKAKDSKKLLDLIFKDKNFKNQIKEWKELNLIDENFNILLLQGKTEEIEKYKTYILIKLAKKYKEKNISMQIHLAAMRNNNKKMFNLIGADTGFDSIADYNIIRNLSYLLDECSKTFGLPKMIFYSLNIKDYYPLSTLIGCFQGDRIKGKMQLGSAWWFCDNKDGMEEQMKILANTGSLPLFIGMLTDSRSFLSYPRHEYFRRILCNILGDWAEKGEVPNDIEFLGNVVKNICFNNAKEYFS
mgnify:CR=1 FL=1